MICGSVLRSSGRGYALKRIFRIYPAYSLVVIIWVFFFGAVFSSEGASQYFQDPAKWTYLRNLLFFPVFYLPGVFTSTPVPNAVNGSLWSLPIEIVCYAIVGTLFLLIFRRNLRWFKVGILFVLAICVAYYLNNFGQTTPDNPETVIWGTGLINSAYLIVFFFVGVLLRLIKPNRIRLDYAVISVGILLIFPYGSDIYTLLQWVLIPYIVIAFGLSATPALVKVQRFGDPSLGIYLWAYPIQQACWQLFGPHLDFFSNLFLVTILSCTFGYLSWHLVEKRFIGKLNKFENSQRS